MEIYTVLVELKIPENIGFIARVIKNFGFRNLCLYRCRVTDKSYDTAANAKDILENAVIVDDLTEFLGDMNFIVATTGVVAGDYKYFRKPIFTPNEIVNELHGKVALLFGREDYGLFNEEIEMCHAIVTIPTSEEYPVMNVSHAAAILLYEISRTRKAEEAESGKLATAGEIEVFLRNLEEMLRMVEYPAHRIRRTIVTFRRILGRSKVRDYEILTLNGILRKTVSFIKRRCK